MSTTLQTYITQVQRLLHDTNGTFWPIAELTDYVNEARSRVAADTKCLRQLITSVPLVAGQELYSVNAIGATATPPISNSIIDVLGISLYWGNSRYKMNYLPFTALDAQARAWQLYQDRPVMFTRMGGNQIYVAPIPDQAYITDWDCAITPAALVNLTDAEVIQPPFTSIVKWWACHLAKFKEQSYGEADMFRNAYNREGLHAGKVFMTRVIPNPYSWP